MWPPFLLSTMRGHLVVLRRLDWGSPLHPRNAMAIVFFREPGTYVTFLKWRMFTSTWKVILECPWFIRERLKHVLCDFRLSVIHSVLALDTHSLVTTMPYFPEVLKNRAFMALAMFPPGISYVNCGITSPIMNVVKNTWRYVIYTLSTL